MRERVTLTLVAAAISLAASGCYKATFGDPSAVPGIEHDRWTDFFVFGLVGDEVVDIQEFCPDGRAAEVRTGGNFPTVLVGLLTIGIYTPRKAYVTCAAGMMPSAAIETEIDIAADGTPERVTRREGGRVTTGTPEPEADGRWRVALASGGVR